MNTLRTFSAEKFQFLKLQKSLFIEWGSFRNGMKAHSRKVRRDLVLMVECYLEATVIQMSVVSQFININLDNFDAA